MNRFSHLYMAVVSVCLLALAACTGVTDSSSKSESAPDAHAIEQPKAPFDPAIPRTPTPSKSLTMDPNWAPAAPTRTPTAKLKARVPAPTHWEAHTPTLGSHPSDAGLRAVAYFMEPLRAVPGTSSAQETDALAAAIREKTSDHRQRIEVLEKFLDAYPQSRWAPVLHLNLGQMSYDDGYFQKALAHWKSAWDLAKEGDDRVSRDLADMALADSAKMNARIGRADELESLLAEAKRRTLRGGARVKITSAAEGAWMMRHRPGLAFRCGPLAALNVARQQKIDVSKKLLPFLDKTQSPPDGFSIPEVQRMSAELGLSLRIAKRDAGAPVIVPAIVHWKLGHFAAVVLEAKGKYLLKDPTFGNDTWITSDVLDQEATGYFLVPTGPLPTGWSHATVAETAGLRGKGNTHAFDETQTAPYNHKVGGSCQTPQDKSLAMATYQFHTMLASLHIEDTPVGYTPAYGPDVRVQIGYNAREAGQPTSIDYTNFGPQFVSNWVSYARRRDTLLLLSGAGGGSVVTHEIPIPGVFPGNPERGEHLIQNVDGTFELRYPDGSQEFYEQALGDPNMGAVRVFMTRRLDPRGNTVTIQYDTSYPSRIHQLIDATGLPTVFHYDYPNEPYLVTGIEDPYGRSATFTYAFAAGAVRLQSTQDVYGITSSFTYDDAGHIDSMTTPYGKTTFKVSGPFVNTDQALIRYVEATDPLGQTERVEFNTGGTGISGAPAAPTPDPAAINFSTSYNDFRNSFYWDKLITKLAPGDYSKARLYHWLHFADDMNAVTSILESEVPPLEGRVYYNYQDQSRPFVPGFLAFPSAVGRVVKSATGANLTQVTKYTYNNAANVIATTDAAGRQTVLDYDTDNVTLLDVKQKTAASTFTTVASYTYGTGAPPHTPTSVTDAAGKTTAFTYSSTSGQVLTITNAKNEVTAFTYETNPSSAGFGRVLTITGDVPGGNRTFTYDTYGRVRTATDSEGYTLTYDYDSLDRLRTITYPDGSTEQLEYSDHSLTATKDRQGRWTRHKYNPLLQRVLTQDPQLRTTQFEWCRCGQLRRFVDANNNITEWARDVGSRVTQKTLPDGSFESFTYDLSGRLSTATDVASKTVTYTYNIDDSVAKKDYSDTATSDVTFAYDPYLPRATSMTDGSGTTTYTYQPLGTSTNGAGQLALVNGPLTDDTRKHTYDELGRLKKLEIVDDATQSTASYSEEYTFDARSRVTAVANNLGSSTYAFVGQSNRPSTVSYANGMQALYDYFGATGDFALKQIKNLTSGGTPSVISQFDYTYRQDRSIETWKEDQGSGAKTWTYGYDDARQLTKAEHRDASQTLLESLYSGYDKSGNRNQVGNGTTAPQNYETNNLSQLLSERDYGRTTFAGTVDEPATVKVNGKSAKVMSTDGGAPFRFEALVDLDAGTNSVVVEAKDGQNNTSTKTYSVATTGASKKYEYDATGNLRYEKQPNGTVIREYRWDQQNRLVKELHGTHEYDRRVAPVADHGEGERDADEAGDVRMVWVAHLPEAERLDGGAELLRRRVRGERGDELLLHARPSRERAGGGGE